MPLRRGLPRVAGGEPWPASGEALAVVAGVAAAQPAANESGDAESASPVSSTDPSVGFDTTGHTAAPAAVNVETVSEEVTLRRGLPRVAGGEPWPGVGTATVHRVVASPQEIEQQASAPQTAAPAAAAPQAAATQEAPAVPAGLDPALAEVSAVATQADPAPATHVAAAVKAPAATPVVGKKPAKPAKPAREPRVIGSRSLSQWVKLGVWGVVGAILAAGIIVLAARGVTTLPGVPEFMERYPGEYHIPEVAEPGFPAWARWSHFLNIFLMALIIRSGLQIRKQQKPPAFWASKRGGRKLSIYLWFHTSLDLLWMLNGAVFVVLLFVSGHWARIVPTSWEVFPNAASALLQYLTLEWPTENGWVNYNSLQQIMYFLVVFVAAPLAIITGLRMSEWWPKKAERLNKIYPAPLARAIHFPTMLFFVLFILIHVFLVFATGALRNLNHMFAGTDEVNWVGFWWFAAGLFVTVAAVFLARPLALAPIASLTGKVSTR